MGIVHDTTLDTIQIRMYMDNIIKIIKYNNMSKIKIKSLYDQLLPEVKLDLQTSARQYSTAKLLKYTLMSKSIWSELSISDINDLIGYTSLNSYQMSPYDFMYGENIIKK